MCTNCTLHYTTILFENRIAAKAVFGSLIKTKERPGMLGVCACPGLRNTRPSRSDGCPQRSLTDDIRTLVEERVKDLIIVATDYEIKHYCGVSNSDYLRLLIEHGIRPWQFSVQDLRPPDLAVSFWHSSALPVVCILGHTHRLDCVFSP